MLQQVQPFSTEFAIDFTDNSTIASTLSAEGSYIPARQVKRLRLADVLATQSISTQAEARGSS